MFVQIRLECKRLMTPGASEVLIRGVGLHVRPQVGPISEGLPAVCAAVGFLTRVRPEMTLE